MAENNPKESEKEKNKNKKLKEMGEKASQTKKSEMEYVYTILENKSP